MTDKELRRLTRTDLLDLLIIERQEIDWDTGKVKKSVVTGQAGYGKHFANM